LNEKPNSAKPIFNSSLRSSQDGQWLWLLSVSKRGLPVDVMDWAGVAAHANEYNFHPQFIPVQDSAWVGPLNVANIFQQLLSTRCGIQTEIVERS
jgi:hypothetical protein